MITTPADILGILFNDLADWCKLNRGVCILANGPANLYELLAAPASGWRLIIHWEGDTTANENVRSAAVVRNHLRFLLDGDLGPTAIPNVALVRQSASRMPFLSILAAVRARIISYRFPWLGPQNDRLIYLSCDDKVEIAGGAFFAAYNMLFDLYSNTQTAPETVILTPPAPSA